MNTKIKQTIALFFTVMLLFVMVLPPLSAAADASPIKVGYYEDGDYMSKSQSGEYSGYNIEYLQKISKQSGLPFEMVDIASWNAAYDMLVKGEGTQANNIFFGSTISNDGFAGESFDFMLSNPPFGTPWKTDLKAFV